MAESPIVGFGTPKGCTDTHCRFSINNQGPHGHFSFANGKFDWTPQNEEAAKKELATLATSEERRETIFEAIRRHFDPNKPVHYITPDPA